ncbi:L-aspartate oxidase [Anaerobacillus sp. MEB173]|uniref:L-aspartate oxidase n=1 Tax=Anaerobacillus sp. MEB173 TaxID=3383345 RepID=UPI003F9150A1
MNCRQADIIIIGSGLAGLMVAEMLSPHKNVIVITKSSMKHSNSMMAQGGIAAAVDRDDNWSDHFFDTVVAGGFHNVEEVTKKLVKKGPILIDKLIELGVPFDKNEHGDFALGQEGAHGRRRILHSGGDATGKALVECLLKRVLKKVSIIEYEMAIDLILDDNGNCIGVNTRNTEGISFCNYANHTILATGGVGQLYPITSNDESVNGDGMAMAYRSGAELTDLEFIQFHPTMLAKDGMAYGLVSEAVRGEGAKLITGTGQRLMDDVHELKELAPRDIVAREIHRALERNEQLFLDITSIQDFETHFPTITSLCKSSSVDLVKGLIPIAPGAHFIMGGVCTDQYGQTTVPRLYAVGEVAHTGVHGANRLASNSLLEAIVFANEVAQNIMSKLDRPLFKKAIKVQKHRLNFELPTIEEIQHMMMTNVGIIRSQESLEKAVDWFSRYKDIVDHNHLLELKIEEKIICNMLTIGYLIATSALLRTESRGGHYRSDYPVTKPDQWYKKQIIRSLNRTEIKRADQECEQRKEGIVS